MRYSFYLGLVGAIVFSWGNGLSVRMMVSHDLHHCSYGMVGLNVCSQNVGNLKMKPCNNLNPDANGPVSVAFEDDAQMNTGFKWDLS